MNDPPTPDLAPEPDMSTRPTLILFLVCATIGVGCGQSGDTQSELPHDFSIVMERGVCYGPCPVYRVTADALGKVTYRGDRFVRVKTPREGRVTQAGLRRLLALMERINFFELEDEYRYWGARCPSLITDAQTVFVSVTRSGVEHQLRHYHGCLGDSVVDHLTAMELEIDRTLGTRGWVFCSEQDSFFETSCVE